MPLKHEQALTAVKELGRGGTPRGAPFHISMLVGRTEELQRAANQGRFDYAGGREALEAIVPASEDEKHAILARYWESVGHDRENTARLVHATRHGNAEARIDAARDYAAQRIAESSPSYAEGAERPVRTADPVQVLRSACGTPAGTEAVRNAEGVWVCPTCASPITEGCSVQRAEA